MLWHELAGRLYYVGCSTGLVSSLQLNWVSHGTVVKLGRHWHALVALGCTCGLGAQVGRVTRAEAAALHLVEGLQRRLRHVTGQVSRALSRPKVLSLEGLQPLVLGQSHRLAPHILFHSQGAARATL